MSLRYVVALCSLLAGCDDFGPRIYSAHPYRAQEGCVERSIVIAVVHADELPATCAPVCLSFEGALYVSTLCAPYPARAAVIAPEEDPVCPAAIAALAADAVCDAEVTLDAGSEAEAGSSDSDTGTGRDAGPDAGGAVADTGASGPAFDAGLSAPDAI
jgi:hypothetical protein